MLLSSSWISTDTFCDGAANGDSTDILCDGLIIGPSSLLVIDVTVTIQGSVDSLRIGLINGTSAEAAVSAEIGTR